jgi:hypothetical protein
VADLEGTRSIEIAAAPERCFAIAADLDRVPEWHGAMTHVEVLERDGDGSDARRKRDRRRPASRHVRTHGPRAGA